MLCKRLFVSFLGLIVPAVSTAIQNQIKADIAKWGKVIRAANIKKIE
jgi:hypothetical protein